LLTVVDAQRAPTSTVTLAYVIGEWLRAAELEDTTRRTYVGYIERTIIPELGSVPADKLTALRLERFYAELRRCRARCDGRPFVERHAADGEHDCVASSCRPHACRPMAASTVRQIHSIISAALTAAERWGWIAANPVGWRTGRARRRRNRTRPRPPTPHGWSTRRSPSMTTGERSSGWP
jgi:integrase